MVNPAKRSDGVDRVRRSAIRRSKAAEVVLFCASAFSILITVVIVATLLYESALFFKDVSIREFVTSREWAPTFEPAAYGILPLVSGTLMTTAIALSVAIPVGTIAAIWLSEYCPHKLREVLKPALELLTAVPTVVFGYFALTFVSPLLQTAFNAIADAIPATEGIFRDLPGSNMLSAGIVMGVMIIPYIASLSEDAMKAVPGHLREGAYAIGATRVQVATKVVYPAALSGITAAYILAVARALGETMIVAIAAGMQAQFTFNPLEPAQTLTAFIVAVSGGDLPHDSIGYRSIFAAGLTLVIITLAFNILGHKLRKRYKEAY